jgi:hypothetical protein
MRGKFRNVAASDHEHGKEWVMGWDKEMQAALLADAEKLNQLTDEDHTPEFLADCPDCGGDGIIRTAIQVYEHGCGFPHDDVDERPCQSCNGLGWFIWEAEGD